MMGRLSAQEALFYQLRLEDFIPPDHLLRRIDQVLCFDDLRPQLAALYSPVGRPSIDPELMIRMLLVGYLYGIRSETRLCEEVHLNLAYRWFCRLGFEGRVPDRSSFPKNRHGRFAQGDVLRSVFEMVLRCCMDAGLVGGAGALVDGSTVEADANRDKRAAPGDLQAAWRMADDVTRPVRAYLEQLDAEASEEREGPVHPAPKVISQTDPQPAWSTKDGPGRFSYETNYLVDDQNAIIVDVEATPARLSQEIVAAKAMLERSRDRVGFAPASLAADKSYGTAPFLAWLLERNVTPFVPVLDRKGQTDGKLTRDEFAYDRARDCFVCPEGHNLILRSITPETGVKRYRPSASACRHCPRKPDCTDGSTRTLVRLVDEDARQSVRDLASTAAYAVARARRKKVEMLFAHLKRHLKLRRLRLRGLAGATEEFLLAATAQNLKRLVKLTPV
ncbi:IS1182 family transposase [Paracoccus sp. (in: a-proteobacteria)]|uniref:IS1182 family transposase n=1 Tax=Paracoccus sp. TaxID=267 RepID=UPI0026E07BDC|nr:IS1182 family transposase [Paracoccus sp. (in: a-proteobacteria)]MDO5371414.1 IS1182 family transposase [Paracoccus sp. (in: a-proteobacteria)]